VWLKLNFVLFSAPIVSEQVGHNVGVIAFALFLIEIILGTVLWLSVKKSQKVISERVEATL